MSWIIFGVYLLFGILLYVFNWIKEHSTEDEKDYKFCSAAFDVIMWICIIAGCLFVLYGIGLFWYYFCGGAIAFEVADNAGDAIMYLLTSLFVLVVALGVIIGIFKK